MPTGRIPVRTCGLAAALAGACYLPLVFVDGWQSAAAIGAPSWWFVYGLATLHHVFLLFGLIGIYCGAARPGSRSSLGAVALTSTGNLLVTGVGAIQLTVLPALAAHPEAASGLDCTPFYRAATAAGASLVAAACEPWHFEAMAAWTGIAWIVLLAGSAWLAVEIFRAGTGARFAGLVLLFGWLVFAAGFAVNLPAPLATAGYLAAAAGYLWVGTAIALNRAGRAAGSA